MLYTKLQHIAIVGIYIPLGIYHHSKKEHIEFTHIRLFLIKHIS